LIFTTNGWNTACPHERIVQSSEKEIGGEHMNIATAIARFVLGLVFVAFGFNGFLNFLPLGPVPPLAGQFAGALIQSHYMAVVLTLEIVCGLSLVIDSYALLATTALAPIIVNILLFHIFMAPAGLPLAVLVIALWAVTAYPYRALLSPLVQRRFNAVERPEWRVLPRNSAARPA
jgi:putative oxidoreductase